MKDHTGREQILSFLNNPVGNGQQWVTPGLIVLAALTGMLLVAWSTLLGPGVGGDATIYLTSAQNLARGIGLGLVEPDGSFRLLPYSAPLFPLMLTPFAAVGVDLTPVARWLNIALFGGMIFLAGWVSLKTTGSRWMSSLPAWLIACSPVLLPVYSWAMAEPVTLVFGFGGLVFLLWHLDADIPHRLGWPELCGLVLGLSAAARYSAAAFLAASLLVYLLWGKVTFRKRLFTAFRIGLVGIIPMAVWMVVQLGWTDSVSARTVLTLEEMRERLMLFWPQLNSALVVWALPASFLEAPPYPGWINSFLPLVFFASLGVLTFWQCRIKRSAAVGKLLLSLWIFTGIYIGLLLLVYLTTYPPITIDNRMLSPAHTAVIWIAGLILVQISGHNALRWWKPVIWIILLGFVSWYGIRTIRIVIQNSETGLGYNARVWRQSRVIDGIKELPVNQTLVTNETMAVLYLTGRVASPVAEIYFDEPAYPFTRYGDGPVGRDPAEAEFKSGKTILVVFDTLEAQFASIYGGKADKRTELFTQGLSEVFSIDHGAILKYPVGLPQQE